MKIFKGDKTMEKKQYITPEMEITRFNAEDIIVTSDPQRIQNDETEIMTGSSI